MSSTLSQRQKEELCVAASALGAGSSSYRHRSLLDYLHASGFQQSYETLKHETQLVRLAIQLYLRCHAEKKSYRTTTTMIPNPSWPVCSRRSGHRS